MSAYIRLNIDDNPKVVVKQDSLPVIVTGNSYYQFTGVTPTVVTDVQTGNLHTISIYTPSGATGQPGASGATGAQGISGITPTLIFTGDAVVNYNLSGTTYTIDISGKTGAKGDTGASGATVVNYYTFIPSGGTVLDTSVPNQVTIFSPTGGTGGGTWGSISGTLSGQTDLWQELEAKALQTDFESHTGDTTIHYKMSGITIQQSQVSGLTTALAGKTNTGTTAQLRTDFNTFSGNTYVMYDNIKVPTGFIDNLNIGVSYDSVNRTITLTKATPIEYYWRGKLYSLGTSWTSVPHTNDTQGWFLYSSDGVTFHWSTQAWIFSNLMVAYKPTNSTIAIREVHGTQDSNTHEELHRVLGCYRVSGFGLTNGTYTLQPATPVNANNTFGLEAGIVADEDLKTNINAWIQDSYTRLYFTSTGVKNYQTAQALPFRMGTTYPLINSYNGSTFTETEAVSGRYFNYYIIRVPVTSDSNSQLYRAIVLQAQFSYTSLLSAQTENPQSLYFGDFSDITPETVIVERITYRSQSTYNGATGRVRIEATAILSGSRFSQTATNTVGNAVTAGNVSVVPVSPFTAIDMQDWTGEAMDYFSQTVHTHDYTGSTILNKPSFVGSGNTDVTLSGNTYIIYSPTGGTTPVLLPSRAVVTNNASGITTSNTSSTEIAYLFGVTSSVQTQLNGKSETSHTHSYTGTSITDKPDLSSYAPLLITENVNTGTTRTTSNTDLGKVLTFSNTGAVTVTLHSGATTGFNFVAFKSGLGGTISFTAQGGTVYGAASKTLKTQYLGTTVWHYGSNNWRLIGGVE